MRRVTKLGAGSGSRLEASKAQAEAGAALAFDILECSFRLRALGRAQGFVTSWGAGSYGFLRSLALQGPQTVPEIARARPTSRQRMQRLADELAEQGLVTFAANPRHLRSLLVRLTKKGEKAYETMTARLVEIAGASVGELSASDLSRASDTVRDFSAKLLESKPA